MFIDVNTDLKVNKPSFHENMYTYNIIENKKYVYIIHITIVLSESKNQMNSINTLWLVCE